MYLAYNYGFIFSWRPQQVSDLAKYSLGGGTPSTKRKEYWKGTIPWFQSSSLTDNCFDDVTTEKRITEEAINNSAAKLVSGGSIAVVTRVGVGKLAYLKEDYTTSQDFLSLCELKHDKYYSLLLLDKTLNSQLAKQGTSIAGITKDELLNRKIILSENKNEQEKIGKFFEVLNGLIAKNQRKLELLEKLKKGYLQKIFSQELRFEGFTEPWKPQKLGEIAKFSKGTGFSKSDLTSSGYPVILYGQLYTDYKTIINKIENYVQFKGKVLSISGQVLIPASGETPEDIARAAIIEQKDVYIGGDLNVLTLASTITPAFIAINLSNGPAKKQLASYAQGKSVVHLRNSDLKKIVIKLPENSEQKQVSTFFYLLDNHIDMCKRKLGQLERLKQTSLRKMFI